MSVAHNCVVYVSSEQYLWHIFLGVVNPLGDVMSFVTNFEDKYGSLHPTFYRGTYSQVSYLL